MEKENTVNSDLEEIVEEEIIEDNISEITINENDIEEKSIFDEYEKILSEQKLEHDASIASLKEIFTEASDEDLESCYNIALRLDNGEEFSVYNSLPKYIQNHIKSIMNNNNRGAHMLAKEFFKDFINQIKGWNGLDAIAEFKAKRTQEIYNNTITELYANFLTDQKARFEEFHHRAELLRNSDAETSDEKAELADNIANAYTETITLSGFMRDVNEHPGKYRLKKFDKENYKKFYKNFNNKYSKENQLFSQDISVVHGALLYGIKTYYPDVDLNENDIINFMLGFIKYTMNYKVSVLPEQVFMSYFITNALTIRLVSTDSDIEIVKELLRNVSSIGLAIKTINN